MGAYDCFRRSLLQCVVRACAGPGAVCLPCVLPCLPYRCAPCDGDPIWQVAVIFRLLLVGWPPQGSTRAGALQGWRVAEAGAPAPPGAPAAASCFDPSGLGLWELSTVANLWAAALACLASQ